MSFDLCVWDKCNNRCRMCTNPDSPWPAWDGSFDYDYESILARLEKRKEEIRNSDSIYLTGGEPTIHPQFLEILKYLKNNFPKPTIKLLSNGRTFSYLEFAKKFLSIDPDIEVDMSLYGPSATIHDRVTQAPGSFEQSFLGLKNLIQTKKENQIVGLRFVLTKESYQYISDFLDLVKNDLLGIDRLIIIFPEYEAQAEKNQDEIMIKYTEVKDCLNSAYEKIVALSESLDLRLYHFPLCQLDKKFWSFAWKTWPDHEVDFVENCEKCQVKKYCVGLHKEYLKNVGSGEVKSFLERVELYESGDKYRPISPCHFD